MSKTKKTFQLRKTAVLRQQTPQQQLAPKLIESKRQREQMISAKDGTMRNSSNFQSYQPDSPKIKQNAYIPLFDQPELIVDCLQLSFEEKINNIQVKNIIVKNIGSSAIYYEWMFRNLPKINHSAIKDPKPKFYCHYEPNVIKPGQQVTFSFSFLSEIPGVFIEECQLVCRPAIRTKIPPIKLKANAYIDDSWYRPRDNYLKKLKNQTINASIRQIVNDIIDQVKSPKPPLPNVSIPEIAEKQFEKMNFKRRLFYNTQVHHWFNELFKEVWVNLGYPQNQLYWDQSIDTIKNLIKSVEDPVNKVCFERRLENYCHMSTVPSSSKSQLYSTIKKFVSEAAYKIGGDTVDEVRKQLDMWEIPFNQPKQEEEESQVKAREEQKGKIKSQWQKRTKKKKWTPEDEQQMMKQYVMKFQSKSKIEILDKFTNFDSQAAYIKNKQLICKAQNHKSYFDFLSRLKTMKQAEIQGKKIFLKFPLQLKPNSEQKLQELSEYLEKKKQEQIRLEEEKKNQEQSLKKKKAPVTKKKKQKQEQETKPLFYDFSGLLNEEMWGSVIEGIKFVIEKQPALILIGFSYGPKTGKYNQKYSVKFLLEHLKKVEPSIEFLTHPELGELSSKLQEQLIGQGSIFLLENINFLPCQTLQVQQVIQPQSEEESQIFVSRRLLMPEIRSQLETFSNTFDIVINEDRFAEAASGITSYSGKQCNLGSLWWKYIGLSLRTKKASLIIGGDLEPEKLLMISRVASFGSKVFAVGQLGLKLWLGKNSQGLKLFDISISQAEKEGILFLLNHLERHGLKENLILPSDFLIQKKDHEENEEQTKNQIVYPNSDQIDPNLYDAIDIGPQTLHSITDVLGTGHVFLAQSFSIKITAKESLIKVARHLYQQQEVKRGRHKYEETTPSGINYEADLVTYLIGINGEEIEEIQLVERKKQIKRSTSEADEEEMQEKEEDEQNEIKKIDLIADFKLDSSSCFYKIMIGQFMMGLKDISRYPKSE